jgi:hypothetical protein
MDIADGAVKMINGGFRMARWWSLLMLLVSLTPLHAGDKKTDSLTLINAAGREEKLLSWQFTAGTRKLSWLGGAPALEFRGDGSTNYVDGILTLIPLASVKAITYDTDKKSVSVTALAAGPKEETLLGSTKFAATNHVTIEGEADLGTLGSAAVKVTGGGPMGLRGLRFPAPRPAPEVKGRPAVIVADDKEKTPHSAAGLVPIYLVGTAYRTLPELRFKKTVKIDLDQIARLRRLPPTEKKQTTLEFEVTLTDGAQHNLTLLTRIELDDGKSAQLVGLVGQVPVGYKVFPPHTIGELRFEMGKKE